MSGASVRSHEVGRLNSRGQAALEAAIILPVLLIVLLAVLQLTSIHQAQLMTEYAAFQAARAGVVWNGSNQRMHDAAMVAILPTLGSTATAGELAATWERADTSDRVLNALPWGGPVPTHLQSSPLKGLVRVDTVNPAHFDRLDSHWLVGANWQEIDFDATGTYPEHPLLPRYIANFYNPLAHSTGDDLLRKATLLSVRVRYLYEMRIPLANWLVFACWYAANAGLELIGAIDRTKLLAGGDVSTPGLSNRRGYDTLYPSEMSLLWQLATAAGKGLFRPRIYLPLTAEYTMRLQSNFYRKWILHERPTWELP